MCSIIINFSAYVFAYCHFIKKYTFTEGERYDRISLLQLGFI